MDRLARGLLVAAAFVAGMLGVVVLWQLTLDVQWFGVGQPHGGFAFLLVLIGLGFYAEHLGRHLLVGLVAVLGLVATIIAIGRQWLELRSLDPVADSVFDWLPQAGSATVLPVTASIAFLLVFWGLLRLSWLRGLERHVRDVDWVAFFVAGFGVAALVADSEQPLFGIPLENFRWPAWLGVTAIVLGIGLYISVWCRHLHLHFVSRGRAPINLFVLCCGCSVLLWDSLALRQNSVLGPNFQAQAEQLYSTLEPSLTKEMEQLLAAETRRLWSRYRGDRSRLNRLVAVLRSYPGFEGVATFRAGQMSYAQMLQDEPELPWAVAYAAGAEQARAKANQVRRWLGGEGSHLLVAYAPTRGVEVVARYRFADVLEAALMSQSSRMNLQVQLADKVVLEIGEPAANSSLMLRNQMDFGGRPTVFVLRPGRSWVSEVSGLGPSATLVLGPLLGVAFAGLLYWRRLAERHSRPTSQRVVKQSELLGAGLEPMLHSVSVGVMLCDADGRIRAVNEPLRQLFAVGEAEPSGFAWSEQFRLYHHDGQHVLLINQTPLFKAIQGEITDRKPLAIRTKAGNLQRVLVSARPIHAKVEQCLGGLMVVEDAAGSRKRGGDAGRSAGELLRVVNEIERVSQDAGRHLLGALTDISHQLLMLESEHGLQLQSVVQEQLQQLIGRTRVVTEDTEALVSYLNVSVGGSRMVDVNLARTMDDACAALRDVLDVQSASVNQKDLPVVRGYSKQLEQLLTILLDNALKYNEQLRPVVDVSATLKNDHWEICVADNGVGIDLKHQQQVFQLRYGVRNVAAEPGLGSGLALAAKIVLLHGGRIWLRSEFSVGTRVYFTLPAVDAPRG